jgi:hypothetical protein
MAAALRVALEMQVQSMAAELLVVGVMGAATAVGATVAVARAAGRRWWRRWQTERQTHLPGWVARGRSTCKAHLLHGKARAKRRRWPRLRPCQLRVRLLLSLRRRLRLRLRLGLLPLCWRSR